MEMTTQEMLEHQVKDLAEALSQEWTYEENEYGEYYTEDGEPTSPTTFISDSLDIEFTVNSRLEFKSATIWDAIGGPGVWIETNGDHGRVYGAWGSDRAEAFYHDDGALSDAAEDLYETFKSCS